MFGFEFFVLSSPGGNSLKNRPREESAPEQSLSPRNPGWKDGCSKGKFQAGQNHGFKQNRVFRNIPSGPGIYERFLKPGLIFFLFSFPVYSDEGKVCDLLEPWEVRVCSETEEGLTHISETLHAQLEASLIRKKVLPEKVTAAGTVVFNIGIQYEWREWNWSFSGGSGFFMFDNRTFFTAYHVLEGLLDGISHWNKIVFKDQKGVQHDFKVKAVKFMSKRRDMAVLEVEGYDGPVLEMSRKPPQEQSYIMGYPEGFKIQSVRAFEATDIHYGAFLELFDCYYGVSFGGSSGGPLVSREGKVEGVFTSMMGVSQYNCSHFLLARKLDFLYGLNVENVIGSPPLCFCGNFIYQTI